MMTLAKHLADYLHFLDGNDTAYRRYLDWHIKSPGLAPGRQRPLCTLCEKLLSSPASGPVNSPGEYYKDIYSWWYREANCQSRIPPF